MGKLLMTVHGCHVLRTPGLKKISVCIRIVVDGMYKFHTKTKGNDFKPVFEETFTVGNTHRFTVIEVFVCNRITFGGALEEEPVLGSCRLSIETLVEGEKRRQNYPLGAVSGAGMAGTVDITLKTDIRGKNEVTISEAMEQVYIKRLTRFLLCNDMRCVGDVGLLMASIKRSQAAPNRLYTHSTESSFAVAASQRTYATFEDLMESLCTAYNCREPLNCTVTLVVEGCTDIDIPKTYLRSHIVTVIRSISQDFVTPGRQCTPNPVWGQSAGVVFDVIDPSSFVLDVLVYIISITSRNYEVGCGQVRVSTLTCDYSSPRQVFIYSYKDRIVPRISGVVHLTMRPHGFGLAPMKAAKSIDRFHERLTSFFYRYDQPRIQQVDLLVNSRLDRFDELMEELEICYGREPGTMQLSVAILEVRSLQRDAVTDLSERDVVVTVTMGGEMMCTRPKRVFVNNRTVFNETFVFDVIHEMDIITIKVVHALKREVVFGRVDFTCLKMQRGVRNDRRLYLVGAAGTTDAYLSGVISIALYSDQIGQPYAVDTVGDSMYAGRLRRYVRVRAPEKLHLVDVTVATVFDMENFMKDIARVYCEEDSTYAVYVTVLGCRHLRSRLGFHMNAYVVARIGIEWFETRVVRNNTEPDFFEFFEFLVDRPREAVFSLIVMDSYSLLADREVGRVVISLDAAELGHQYHNWIPLNGVDGHDHGVVGVKYVVKDLNLRNTPHPGSEKLTISLLQQCDAPVMLKDERHSRHMLRSCLDALHSKFSSATAHFQLHSLLPNNISDTTAEANSARGSDLVWNSHEPLNIMDQRIHSAQDFLNATQREDLQAASGISHFIEELETMEMPVSPFVRSSDGKMRLHVHLLSCHNLYCRTAAPNPYVMLSTLNMTHKTSISFETVSPEYNELFLFPVTNPSEDFLTITVVTETVYGKKCLGCCMISMKNMQRDTPKRRDIALVVASRSPAAREIGTVCLTLFSENFGLDYTLPVDTENRFRDLMHCILLNRVPTELYRFEWYVGEYLTKGEELVSDLFGKYDAKISIKERVSPLVEEEILEMCRRKVGNEKEDEMTEMILSVKNVTNLYFKDNLLMFCRCFVEVKDGGKTYFRTRKVPGANGSFTIQEDCHLRILHPMTKSLRLTVHVVLRGETCKCGECVLSLTDLHQNAGQERTHYIVMNAGLPSARAVGYITVLLFGGNGDSPVLSSMKRSEKQYLRMRDYYFYYIPEELHCVDVHYSRTLNVEAHIKKLTEKHGPEPGRYNLRIKVISCYSLAVNNGLPYCVIQAGLWQFKTNITHGDGKYVFMEAFEVSIGLPDRDELQLIVLMLDESTMTSVEAGRTMLPIKNIVRGKEMYLKLPLLYRVKTKSESLQGFLEVSILTHDIGIPLESLNASINNGTTEHVRWDVPSSFHSRICSRSFSRCRHSVEGIQPILPNAVEVQGQTQTPIEEQTRIVLLGFCDFPEEKVYIKVKMNNGKTLLRTGNLLGAHLLHIQEEFLLDTFLRLEDVILTVKLAAPKLTRSCVLCYCDFMITECLPGGITTKWLHLFDKNGNSLGKLSIRVEMPTLASRHQPSSILSLSSHELESVTEDLSSLLKKYSPKELRRLDVIISRSDNMRVAHRVLRQQLVPQVQFTVYCEVHEINLLNPVKRRCLVVEAAVGDDVVCTVERRSMLNSLSSTVSYDVKGLHFPFMRIDISRGDALRIRVLDSDGKKEIGRAVLSLRALLTPQLYDMGELISVSLVKVRRQRNKIHATLSGTLSFSLRAPAFECYPVTSFLFGQSSRQINRQFVRSYLHRICSLLKEYDANSVANIHWVVYEKYVLRDTWAVELPNVLYMLIEKWGPEVESFEPIPLTDRED